MTPGAPAPGTGAGGTATVARAPSPGSGERGGVPRWVTGAAAAAVLTGVVLRFLAPADLWLDEAQSVAIARLPVPELLTALRQDGSPPLYYLLLHGWTGVVGESAPAVRALSGLCAVLALPVAWLLGRQLAGRRGAVALTLVLAASPYAVRYASEARMYSLLVLLVLLGGLAVRWAVSRGGPAPVLAVAAGAAALLLTHYWSVHLLAVTGLACLLALRRHRAPAVRVLTGLALGALAFLPWLPSLRSQLAHTGTPWARTGGLSSIPSALRTWHGGTDVTAVLLTHAQVCLAVLALVAVPAAVAGRPGLALAASRSRTRWTLLALSAGTLVVGGLVSWVTGSAVSGRYTGVALPAFLALVACGLATVPGRRGYAVLTAVVVLLGLGGAASSVRTPRTQAGEVASALVREAAPGDVVAFCPDQLGPSVSRLAPPGLDLVVYPDLRPADRVDWTDYTARHAAADPASTAAALDARAGAQAVWVVTGEGFRVPSEQDCRDLRQALTELRGEAAPVVARRPGVPEGMRVHRFPG